MSFARLLATWFGCGYSPIAPGTVGTIGTLPLVYVLCTRGIAPYWAVTLALTVLGVWASTRTSIELEDEDPSEVVIDEVAGTLIAVGLAAGLGFHVSWRAAAVAVLLFRLFDIWKPGPIDSVQSLPRGWGIMADDVLAGIAAGLLANAVAPWLG